MYVLTRREASLDRRDSTLMPKELVYSLDYESLERQGRSSAPTPPRGEKFFNVNIHCN